MRLVLLALLFISFTINSCKHCDDSKCLNGGSCVDGKCQCTNQYTGANCEKNLCDSVVCNNGGNCLNGACACAAGYEGQFCDSIVANKFIGTYNNANQCTDTNRVAVAIYRAVNTGEILITYLDQLPVIAKVSGYDVTVFSQEFAGGTTIEGNGSLSVDRKTLTITTTIVENGTAPPVTCTFTLTRR